LKKIFDKFRCFDAADLTNQVFLITLSIIIAGNYNKIENWYIYLGLNIVLNFILFYFISRYEQKSVYGKSISKVSKFIRFWYVIFVIILFFKEIYLIMISFEPSFYDDLLIKIDYWIFGIQPAQFLYQYKSRLLTEILQITYSLFYLMPVIFGLDLYLRKRFDEFKYSLFVIFFGFYLSFIGYLILPAIGPRFTLFNFQNLNTDLPGLFFTNVLRDLINLGESIPKEAVNPAFIAQRDAFPSGHTELILLIVYLSHKLKSKSFYFYLPYAILMIFSTIYLRYHYVIDIIGGFIFAVVTVLITNWIYNRKSSIGSVFRKRE